MHHKLGKGHLGYCDAAMVSIRLPHKLPLPA